MTTTNINNDMCVFNSEAVIYDISALSQIPLETTSQDKKFTLNLCRNEESFYEIVSKDDNEEGEKYYIGKTVNFTMINHHLLATLESSSKCTDDKTYNRSSIVTFTCDRHSPNHDVALLSNRHDCFFLFGVNSRYACGIQTQVGTNPWAVFSVIAVIALLVYFIGGIMYRRRVLYKRGWKQFPQWEIWCGIATIIGIAVSSCFEKIGLKKKSVHNSWISQDEMENTLIDELDEDLGSDEE